MISQSSNFMANTALEEWVRRNAGMRPRPRSLLLLSSSQVNKGDCNIKAFFLAENLGAGRGGSSSSGGRGGAGGGGDGGCGAAGARGDGQTAGQAKQEQDEQARLVFGSLPKDAVMTQLPVVTIGEDDKSVLISVPLESPKEGDVVCTLQTIADGVINQGEHTSTSRISLVRPDGGWFPGIQEIQADMEASLDEIAAIRKDKKQAQPRLVSARHNSYGSYF